MLYFRKIASPSAGMISPMTAALVSPACRSSASRRSADSRLTPASRPPDVWGSKSQGGGGGIRDQHRLDQPLKPGGPAFATHPRRQQGAASQRLREKELVAWLKLTLLKEAILLCKSRDRKAQGELVPFGGVAAGQDHVELPQAMHGAGQQLV